VNDDARTRLTVGTYRKISKDEVSTEEEVKEIINNLHKLSNLVYDIINTNENEE
jgi:hypothetical protein